MNVNWKIFKILVALVVIVGVVFWAVDLIRPHNYSGTDLNFGIGNDTVSVTNPSQESVPVQIVGPGFRTFRVSTTIEDVSGSSAREGTGTSSSQVFAFDLPPGTSEFTVARGSDLHFEANTNTRLEATVESNNSETSLPVFMSILVVLGAIYYISRTTDHAWLRMLRNQEPTTPDLKPVPETAAARQGRLPQSYGDNRTKS